MIKLQIFLVKEMWYATDSSLLDVAIVAAKGITISLEYAHRKALQWLKEKWSGHGIRRQTAEAIRKRGGDVVR